jgi:multiple sugar transport system permease protein
MVLPYVVLLVAFGIAPVIQSLGVAYFGRSLRAPNGGIDNFIVAFTDFRFMPAVLNVGAFLLIYVPAIIIAVTAMALLLDTIPPRWSASLRVAYIVPACITGSVAILVWYFMLEPQLSPFRGAFEAIGITRSQQIWSQPNLVVIFALMAFFTGAGNWIVLQYGSLQSISVDLLEAARIDGANGIQIAFRIKLPLIRPYLVYMAVLCFAAGVQVFVEPQLISSSVFRGLAANWSINQLSYSFAFKDANLAGAAAISLALLFVCLVAAVLLIVKTDLFAGEKSKR